MSLVFVEEHDYALIYTFFSHPPPDKNQVKEMLMEGNSFYNSTTHYISKYTIFTEPSPHLCNPIKSDISHIPYHSDIQRITEDKDAPTSFSL